LLDLMGLVSPRLRPFVASRRIPEALRRWPAELVVSRPEGRRALADREWFRRRYELATTIAVAGGGGAVEIYRRRDGDAGRRGRR
jgi:hypothetical protein